MLVVQTFKISYINSQVSNVALLAIITMLHIKCPELIHLTNRTLYPLTNFPFPLSDPKTPGNHYSKLCF